MIWSDSLATYAFVNNVFRQTTRNGGEMIKVALGTSEKNRNGEGYINSSWIFTLGGQARKNFEAVELAKGDKIIIRTVKFSKQRVKKEDGTYIDYDNSTMLNYDMQEPRHNNVQQEEAVAF